MNANHRHEIPSLGMLTNSAETGEVFDLHAKIGCCGFPVSQSKYYREFGVVELQSTFYQPPREKTAIRWREEAPPEFEFTVKAWQAITHPSSSPTWRKTRPSQRVKGAKYGLLKPTRENFQAWNRTLEMCQLLRSRVVVIQCPPRFNCTLQNVRNMRRFFKEIERGGLILVWEPRGDWHSKPEEIRRICQDLKLVHCVDLCRRQPAHLGTIGYFRLHGLGPKEVNYSYKYTDQDLSSLTSNLSQLAKVGLSESYVMFNNVNMLADAKRFMDKSRALAE